MMYMDSATTVRHELDGLTLALTPANEAVLVCDSPSTIRVPETTSVQVPGYDGMVLLVPNGSRDVRIIEFCEAVIAALRKVRGL